MKLFAATLIAIFGIWGTAHAADDVAMYVFHVTHGAQNAATTVVNGVKVEVRSINTPAYIAMAQKLDTMDMPDGSWQAVDDSNQSEVVGQFEAS